MKRDQLLCVITKWNETNYKMKRDQLQNETRPITKWNETNYKRDQWLVSFWNETNYNDSQNLILQNQLSIQRKKRPLVM